LLEPPAIPAPFRAASPGLTRGYATAQTDGGHSSPASTDASWTRNNPVAVTDFSHRAIHEMTVLGKQVVASITVAPRRRTTTRHAPLADAWA
jgi:hypothetical protein